MSRGIEDEREKKVGFGTFVRKRYVEMVHSSTDWAGRLRWSYKRATFILCTGNLLVALVMLHAALAPVFFVSTSTSQLPRGNGVSAHGARSFLPIWHTDFINLECLRDKGSA